MMRRSSANRVFYRIKTWILCSDCQISWSVVSDVALDEGVIRVGWSRKANGDLSGRKSRDVGGTTLSL